MTAVALQDSTAHGKAVAPIETLADLLEQLGGVPLARIRFRPYPGTATEQDVLDAQAHRRRICELVDGVLVEKPMGFPESVLAGILIRIIGEFVQRGRYGTVSGPDGMMRLEPGLVRAPDVAYISAARRPKDLSRQALAPLAPDLAIEILSPSNTANEMARKMREYFDGGARLAWVVDPDARNCTVFTSPNDSVTYDESGALDGADVLPGFSLSLRELFAQWDDQLGLNE